MRKSQANALAAAKYLQKIKNAPLGRSLERKGKMPIDYQNYPTNWKSDIRPTILARAQNECEECSVPNYVLGYRGESGAFHIMAGYQRGEMVGEFKIIKIILTISHQDHDINNNDPSNLKALCQRCHLRYDSVHHAKMRGINRRKKEIAAGQMTLFEMG